MFKTSELATGELTEKGINQTAHHLATVLTDQGSLKSQEGASEGSSDSPAQLRQPRLWTAEASGDASGAGIAGPSLGSF